MPDRSVFTTTDAETRLLTPTGVQAEIDALIDSFTQGNILTLSATDRRKIDGYVCTLCTSYIEDEAAEFILRVKDR